jgi:hypothetical protein
MSTLPHEREKTVLGDIIDDCLEGRNRSVLIIAPVWSQVSFLAKQARDISEGLEPSEAKRILIYREALEFDNGAVVKFVSYSNPNSLRGIKADRVVLMGEWGEFWYLLNVLIASGATVEGAA